MKKYFVFIPIVIAAVLIFLFSRCEKEVTYPVKVICNFSETGIDTGAVIVGATVTIGKDNYAPFAQATGLTDATGAFKYTFQYEALLDITTTYTYIEDGVTRTYIGAGQIKLMPDQLVEKTILMIEQQ
ncbi:MAG: hypothetical protein CVU02_00885 [Bacteroidetes bacterium HGW-Bacteroidetes-19]|nr:MAG: hypothetical protein CVU04_05060 [Bacteroidetes bacterium HGW-Bacteroidetes-20]PKP28454.1 MAG: hypothetical protein CVU02_00885 [Bacteroidetes bacterium HGW-Bacteroidetes-19]